jgi:hypothetical protein
LLGVEEEGFEGVEKRADRGGRVGLVIWKEGEEVVGEGREGEGGGVFKEEGG